MDELLAQRSVSQPPPFGLICDDNSVWKVLTVVSAQEQNLRCTHGGILLIIECDALLNPALLRLSQLSTSGTLVSS